MPEPADAPLPTSTPTPDADLAGGSARREYERRSSRELARKQQRVDEDAEWRERITEEKPVVGRLTRLVTPKPTITPESQPTTAWKVGAEGERRVAEVLAGVAGIEVLHDRLVPGSRANLDHLVIGPRGVFVVDAKKYREGSLVEVRDKGGLLRADVRLFVGERDQTKLVDAVRKQMEVVRNALGPELADVPVHGALCFVGATWGLLRRPKVVKGVTAIWPKGLPGHVSAPGPHRDRVETIATHLRATLRPAT